MPARIINLPSDMDQYYDDAIPPRRTERQPLVLPDTTRRARSDSSRHIGYSWGSDIPPLPTRQRPRYATSSSAVDVPVIIMRDNSSASRSLVAPRSPVSRSSRSRIGSPYYDLDSDSELEDLPRERRRSQYRRVDGSRSPSLDKDRIASERLELEREREVTRMLEREMTSRIREREKEREVEERRKWEQERREQERRNLMRRGKMHESGEGEEMKPKDSVDLESNKVPEAHEQETKSRGSAIPEGEGLESKGEDSKLKSPSEREEREEREKQRETAEMAEDAEEAIKKKAIEEYKRMREEIELKAKKEKEHADRLFKEKLQADLLAAGCSKEGVERILKDNNPGAENKTLQEKEKEDTLFEEAMKARLLEAGHTADQIEQILKYSRKARRRSVGGASDPTRPTYTKVKRKYLLPETLDKYKLPWELDHVSLITAIDGFSNSLHQSDPDYLIIKCSVPEKLTDELFAHTRATRAIKERPLLSFAPGENMDREKLYIVRKKTPSGRQRS
jgi:hypothetical protein